MKIYASHSELNDSGKGLSKRMTKGRKTTVEERKPEDELRLKIQQMERENERLCAENLLLKKLGELERRRR